MKKELLRFTLSAIIIYLTGTALNLAIAASQPSEGNGTHFCGVVDGQWNKRYSDQFLNRRYAQSFAANLNVGEPRTVRMIYFLPNDRPYRVEVVQRIKDEILNIQTFFAEQMDTHGYGKTTFRVETNAQGEPIVHRVDGGHPDSYYLDNPGPMLDEIERAFNLNANIYLIVIDNSIERVTAGATGVATPRGRSGGFVLVNEEFSRSSAGNLATHELGHAFGLGHNFRDGTYIMSYGSRALIGPSWDRLSACHAEYLSVHPYFNPAIPLEEGQPPTIELISPRTYPPGSMSVPVRVQVSDSEGVHQVLLSGSGGLIACRGLAGEKDALIEFDYEGFFTPDGFTSLSDSVVHPISVHAVDTDGNVSEAFFSLAEISRHHIAPLEGHTAEIYSVSFSPDGGILASGSWDSTVKLWDVATRQAIAPLEGDTDVVNSVSFSPDGGTLASGSWNGTVKLWDVTTRQIIATLEGHTEGVSSVSFSPDGGILASGSWDSTVKLWDVATRQNIATLERHTEGVNSVSFSPDGGILASGSWDGTVKLWDVATRQNIATLEGHTEGVLSVSFSPDGRPLASGSWDGTVKLWDVVTRQNIATLEGHTEGVIPVSFSPDGGTLASGSWDSTVKLWDVATGVNFATLGHTSAVYSVSFSPDGRTFASGTYDGTVELWDASGWMQLHLEAVAEVDIPDANLRAAIATALGKQPSDPIRRGDMANLTELEAPEAGISNLTGLEGATNLRWLLLWDNSISDISVVSGLTNLTELYLDGNSITDISAVSGLTELTELGLWGNSITDISALAGLTELTWLDLSGNSISDISAVSDLTGLTELYLWDNSISDISAVSGLTNLARLWLSNNSISDISAVSGLTNLTELYLWDNSISDISVVSGLTELTSLNLGSNSISDISPLVANTGLGSGDEVFVQRNPLSYLSIHTHIPTLQSRGVTVEFDDQAHPALLKISGDNQKDVTGAALENPFVVEVQDANGSAFAGVPVTFVVTTGSGTLSTTRTTTDANGRAESTLTLGPNLETNTVSVSATGIEGTVTFHAISDTPFIEYLLSILAGISLIHVPLKVTAVDEIEKTIESVGDVYDALGGASRVNFLITYDPATQGWLSYFVPSDKGTPADRRLTDDLGIIAGMKSPTSVRLKGDALGTDGSSTIALNQGLNLVALPLNNSRINRVSDLFALDGIGGNVPVIILTDGGEFKAVGRAGDPGDIEITGGQSFILTAQRAAIVEISGDAWINVSGTSAAPQVALTGIEVGNTTPVLGLRGLIIDEGTGLKAEDFRVTVKNLSTSRAVAAIISPDEAGYRSTVVDIETGRAATVGDILEISAQSPNPFIGVKPLRYTVTAEDVKQSLIQLPELVAYEIPAETQLLANYPNPFNPETWIPYRLAEDAFVTLTIYDGSGQVVRTLDVGHQTAAVYENRSKAIYWDGRNEIGEQVASGVYFYHLSAGDYSTTRKMVILK